MLITIEQEAGPLKVEAFYRSRPVFRVSPQATHEKQEKRVFARTPRAPARGLLPLATPLSRLLNRPALATSECGETWRSGFQVPPLALISRSRTCKPTSE